MRDTPEVGDATGGTDMSRGDARDSASNMARVSRLARPSVLWLALARLEHDVELRVARVLWRRGWRVRILAFTSYGRSATPGCDGTVRVMARALLTDTPGPEAELVRGWRRFLTLPLPGVPVDVRVGGLTKTVTSGYGGYLDADLALDLAPGWHDVTMLSAHGEPSQTRIRIVGPQDQHGIVSDIDDTVMITALPRPLRAFWNTFVRHESSRRPVPGMAGLFKHLGDPGHRTTDGPFMAYVSTGPWNVAPSLERFLARHGYPPGPLLMTDWGPTEDRWFRSGRQHKHDSLRRLLDDLPGLTWTLVGDDGQHDPALYEDLVTEHVARVRQVLIRELTPTEQVLTHGSPVARPGEHVPDRTSHPRTDTSGVPVFRGPDGDALMKAVDAADRP